MDLMIEIFVVDMTNMVISRVEVSRKEWLTQHYVRAKIGLQSILVFRGEVDEYTNFAGFASKKAAKDFVEFEKAKGNFIRSIRTVEDIAELEQALKELRPRGKVE